MPEPTTPAPVSGPGALSQRTDGGPASQGSKYVAGMPYGEGADFMDLQSSAKMEGSAPVRALSPGAVRQAVQSNAPQSGVVPFGAPTQNPDQPITHGADAGVGPGMDSLGLNTGNQVQDNAFKQQLASYMPALMYIASRPDTSPETRTAIKELRENM